MRPAALVSSVLAELKRDPDKRSDPYTIEDFLPATREQEIESELAESGADLAAFEAYKQRLGFAGLKPKQLTS